MKKILSITILVFTASALFGQKSIDALFEKYSGKDGFVTVTFNGNLLKLFSDNEEDSNNHFPAEITELRILTQEDHDLNVGNFYDLAMENINVNDYEEFMRVKESNQDLRMLVKIEGKRFREFLLISGGDDNAIIQIKGDMSLNEAKRFSDHAKKNKCIDLVADHK